MPNHDDCLAEADNLRDVFGRTRHASHKDNMTGIGSFNKECRTIFVHGIPVPQEEENPLKAATQLIYKLFSKWGEIEDIAISQKGVRGGNRAFIKYAHRYYAEFAREAMTD